MTHNYCSVSDVESELNVGYNYFDLESTPTRDMVESWIQSESDYIRAITVHPLGETEETLTLDQEHGGRLVYCKNGYLASVSLVEVNEGTEYNPDWVEVSEFYISNSSEGVLKVNRDVSRGPRKVRVTGVFGRSTMLPLAKALCIFRVVKRALSAVASKQVYDNPVETIDISVVSIKFRPDRVVQYIQYYSQSANALEARLDSDNSFTSMLV